MLWEGEFYEDGKKIADRIADLSMRVSAECVAQIAVEARSEMHLRHVPLLLCSSLARTGKLKAETLEKVIQRADEMGEFLALYWRDGKCPLSKQVKKGLARAFGKFNAYQLAKYTRSGDAIKPRDVMFLCHPKPEGEEQAETWKKLANQELEPPDTWEVGLSAGKDKKETWERLLREEALGYMALLRNLRNMDKVGVDDDLIRSALVGRKGARRVLPFRFVAAARAVPRMEPWIDEALLGAIGDMPKFSGTTAVMVDVSGSMSAALSGKSDLTRMDAAAALASVFPGETRVVTFSHQAVECPPRKGMAGIDSIMNSQPHGGTYLGAALAAVNEQIKHDRIVVITDEQSHDKVPGPKSGKAYMINVASNKRGVGYGPWTHIDGFSESIFKYMQAAEA
jgi:hypothetical protein